MARASLALQAGLAQSAQSIQDAVALGGSGSKNYLHVGSDAGGHTAAVRYTLLGTAKLNGINPHRYVRHVLERIADHPSNCIDELLPWVVAAKWADDTNLRKHCRWQPDCAARPSRSAFGKVGAMSKTTSIEPGASTLAYQLYVELEWVQPKVWRRLLVPITIDLPLLHATLLFGMGWQGGTFTSS